MQGKERNPRHSRGAVSQHRRSNSSRSKYNRRDDPATTASVVQTQHANGNKHSHPLSDKPPTVAATATATAAATTAATTRNLALAG